MKLSQILKETRNWAEIEGHKIGFPEDLMGMCAIVSKKLFNQLKKNGYKVKIVYNPRHCFVILNNRIIDLTATQFGKYYPKIHIIKLKKYQSAEYKIYRIFENEKQLTDYQVKTMWPKHQI